jgi:hypothetical protein
LTQPARPIDEHNEHVPLYNFDAYRQARDFDNPCCLCACERKKVTPTIIYVATTGPYRGFWVASCAQKSCGYFGTQFTPTLTAMTLTKLLTLPVALDDIYIREDTPEKFFPRKGAYTFACVPNMSNIEGDNVNAERVSLRSPAMPKGLKSVRLGHDGECKTRHQCCVGINADTVAVPKFNPPPNLSLGATELISRLDTWLRPGITKQQFKELFAECDCGLVMTQRMFDRHECIIYRQVD